MPKRGKELLEPVEGRTSSFRPGGDDRHPLSSSPDRPGAPHGGGGPAGVPALPAAVEAEAVLLAQWLDEPGGGDAYTEADADDEDEDEDDQEDEDDG